MTGFEKLFVVKVGGSLASTSLPGSTLASIFKTTGKTIGAVKKAPPVVGKGLNTSGLAKTKPEKIV